MHNVNPQAVASTAKIVRAVLPAILATGGAAIAGIARSRRKKRGRPRRATTRDVAFSAPVSRGRIINRGKLPTIRIRHREYLRDIDVTASTDARWTVPINPGMSFPWLSSVAMAFEKYKMRSLTYEFVTSTATSTTGAIALIPEYDPDDMNEYLDKTRLYMFDGLVRGPLWNSLRMSMKCPNKWFYTRGSTELHESKKWHDVGQLIIDVTDPSVTATIGEIWAEYDVEFTIPQHEEINHVLESFETTNSYAVAAGSQYSWLFDESTSTGRSFEIRNHLTASPYGNRNCLKIWEAGDYTVQVRAAGGTAITAVSTPVLEPFYVGTSTVTKTASVVNSAATEILSTYLIHVSEEFLGTYGVYTRSSKYPVYINMGTLLASAAPSNWYVTVSGGKSGE